MSITTYQANIVLSQWFTNTAGSYPATYYVGLYIGDPSVSGVEPVGNAYARTGVVRVGGWSTPSGGVTSNVSAITFPESSGTWGTITHVGILDASSGGNLLYYQALTTSRTVSGLTTVNFPAGQFTITLSN